MSGKFYRAVANGQIEACYSLQQAIYRVHDFTRGMTVKIGHVHLPDGTLLEYNGQDWKNALSR